MKTIIVLALALAVQLHAADALTERLQRGLFEEEANRNLDAAIKEYQSVVAQSDDQRKVTATALFRLGECYRKLGKTNEAAAFYQRITRDFSEQEQLAKLAGDILKPTANATGNQSDYVRELQRRIASLRVDSNLARTEASHLAGISPEKLSLSSAATNDFFLASLQSNLLAVDQKLVSLKSSFSDEHPELKAATALRTQIIGQVRSRLEQIVASANQRANLAESQLTKLEAELTKAEVQPGTTTPAENAPAQ